MPWVVLDAHGYGNRVRSRTISTCAPAHVVVAWLSCPRGGWLSLPFNFYAPHTASVSLEATLQNCVLDTVAAWNEPRRTNHQEKCDLASRVWYLDNVASAC